MATERLSEEVTFKLDLWDEGSQPCEEWWGGVGGRRGSQLKEVVCETWRWERGGKGIGLKEQGTEKGSVPQAW